MAKSKTPADQRWVTIGGRGEEGGKHGGRHVLIDGKGNIVGGAIPKSWQGHNFKDAVSGAAKDLGNMYHEYNHDELKQIHGEFKDSHKTMQKGLAEDVHGLASMLRDNDAEGEKEGSILRRINAIGKIHFGSNKEYHEDFKDIHPGVKKAVGTQKSKQGMGLDVMADELGMSQDDLLDHLKAAQPYKYKKISDYHDEAKKQMGKDYTNRLKDVEHMGKHVKAIEAAMNRHKHGTVKREKDQETEKGAQDIWKQFAGQADKQIPGAKDAHDKGGAHGLMDHIATTSPKQYEALKKNMAAKVKDGGDKISDAQKRANEILQKHKAPKKQAEKPQEEPTKDNVTPIKKKEEQEPPATKAAEGPQSFSKGDPKQQNQEQPKGKRTALDDLHDDATNYMKNGGDVNDILKKHDKLITRMAAKTARDRGREQDAEDFAQNGRLAAAKTLESLKNGTQKAQDGAHLGTHVARRIKQGINEGARQDNENKLSRGGAKLAAVINSERQKHLNETGQEPNDDQLFDRVKGHEDFKGTKFTKPGTKQSLEDREKFDEVRKATKGQKSQATLDQDVKGKDGDNAGTVGSNMADASGSAEDQAVKNEEMSEAERQKQEQVAQIGDAMKEFGLSPSQAQAVVHRFGVGHGDDSGIVKDWDHVAKHMSKNLGKQVNGETAKRHYYDGLKKLHKHIGDERMGALLQKSLIDSGDMGAYLLVKSLYELALLDLMKSHDMAETAEFTRKFARQAIEPSMSDLLKSLAPGEYLGEHKLWADGSVTAHIESYRLKP